jgi:3-isopropylmalate/(R)-2-methylmalate dehydratase small subunit
MRRTNMPLEKKSEYTGKAVFVPGDDIDTDRIIPARFMKCVTFDGLGEFMFYDVRKDSEGNNTKHPLNDPRFKDASILISGDNFGCGSSREHAPQAISKAGYNAIIAEGYGEIFFGNATQLGMICVTVEHSDRVKLEESVIKNPEVEISLDLTEMKCTYADGEIPVKMRESSRYALLNGKWNPLEDLLANSDKVEETALKLGSAV